MKKWKTPKAIASQKKIDKILIAYGKAHLSDGKVNGGPKAGRFSHHLALDLIHNKK